jgi:hypothetical protein
MTNFEELFRRFNPLHLNKSYDEGYQDGIKVAYRTMIAAVSSLDVDSFDDICYKEEVLDIIKEYLTKMDNPWVTE